MGNWQLVKAKALSRAPIANYRLSSQEPESDRKLPISLAS
jgi:hypothetical protein